nr:capsule assembly Wzi family protein [Granulicella aggregans]
MPPAELPPPTPPSHPFPEINAYDPGVLLALPDRSGSVYIPVDNWIYPELVRLYELGYADTLSLGLRPWTRRSVLHVLEKSQAEILNGDSEEAKGIFATLVDELDTERETGHAARPIVYGTESVYTRLMGISGTPLRDSFHLGQTISNDYGRPYEHGFNAIAGFSTLAEAGRFSLYVRAEYEHAPSATGYSLALANQLSLGDIIGPYQAPNAPQATIPAGPISAQNPFRIVEANLSYHVLSHEISFGKSDAWLGPAAGASMAWSNNAEDIYSFRINRIEPLRIPLLSRITGPFRYDFFYGSLKGHTAPNSPYVHSESLSFQPTGNLQIGFQRTIIFGGKDHAPVTLHTFLKGFFSTANTTAAEKFSRADPGARFSSFNLSYRLPYLRHYATFYVDSNVHDDVSPIDAPRRAAFRTGIDLSQFPRIPKLELRVEAVSTDPRITQSQQGGFFYYETVQKQGYTNKGLLLGDSIGREAKGGQAWLTYHLAPKEWIQLEYLNKKIPNDFVGGTTQNQFKASVVKRFHQDIELNAYVQYEAWKAPIYKTGRQSDTTAAAQVTWFPKLHSTTLNK